MNLCGDGNNLYPDCINVKIQDIILLLPESTIVGNWSKGTQDLLYSFSQLYANLQLSENKV